MPGLEFDLSRFEREPVLGIIRGVTMESLSGVMEAAISAGLRFLEITLNTPSALRLIEVSVRDYSDSLCIGAGTVLSAADAKNAVSAGARFLVSPSVIDEVSACCRENSWAYFPGALTPTEVERAWKGGAVMVKVFPASQMGPEYFNLLRGPFPNIPLIAVGGIDPQNLVNYFQEGASAVALGGSVFSEERMRKKQFHLIQKDIEDFLLAVRAFYSKIQRNIPLSGDRSQ